MPDLDAGRREDIQKATVPHAWVARVNTLPLPECPFRNLELWTWLQIDSEQCLMCGVKSSLALVKPSSLLLRSFSNPCLRDESSGGFQEPDTGAGESGEPGRDTAGGGWASAGLSQKAETKFLMYLTKRDSPECPVARGEWRGGDKGKGVYGLGAD